MACNSPSQDLDNLERKSGRWRCPKQRICGGNQLLACSSVVGLAGSTYLTISHFDTHIALVCPDLGPCDKILTSNTSHFLGIPVPVLGLLYFVPMTLLCLPALWRSKDRRIHLALFILSALGVTMVLYLFVEELFIFQAFSHPSGGIPTIRFYRHIDTDTTGR